MSKTIENLKSGNYEVVDNRGVSVTTHFIECLEKEFADLEAKLAESERIIAKLSADETVYNEVIENLETKLEESEKLNKGYLSLIDNYIYQLNEKDELLRQKINKMKSTDFIKMCVSCGFMVQAKEIDNQKAIDELEKLLEKTQTLDVMVQSGHYINQKKVNVVFKDAINQQITQLKGEK